MKEKTFDPKTGAKYNEPKLKVPNHLYPKDDGFDLRKNPGIGARLIIEKVLQSFEGVNVFKLKDFDVTSKDLVTYRKHIKSALYALIKEDCGHDLRLRTGTVSYLSALKFVEASDLVAQIALNPGENSYVRGYAAEALRRFGGNTAISALEKLINDPIDIVREMAVRGIGYVGSKKNIAALTKVAGADIDPEVRYRATAAIQHLETGKKTKRPTGTKEKKKLVNRIPDILKPIGRHGAGKPQTTPGSKGDERSVNGGVNVVANKEIERVEIEKPTREIAYEILSNSPKGTVRVAVRGTNVGNALKTHSIAKLFKRNEDEIVLDFPEKQAPIAGHSLDLNFISDQVNYHQAFWVPDAPNAPVVYEIESKESVIWTKDKFSLRLKFYAPATEKTACLILKVRMPKTNWREVLLNVTAEELRAGEKIIDGFVAAVAGEIDIDAKLYCENGGAGKYQTTLTALPSNPIAMIVTPTTAGTIGEGPAVYNSSEDRFYCYANLRVTNGFAHAVTIGPRVSVRVTDGGAEKDNFSFNISTSTVPANSSRTVGIYMYFGGNTYDVFKDFGDVTIRITLQTSEGDVVDSNIWAAMGQVKLALNFVGNFSGTTRAQLQSLVDNEASAIYEQQNLFISETAQFLLTSSNSDFNRYRDIEMDDNKDSDCTSGSNEADDLRDDWSSPNDSWLDVWLVETLSGPPCSASVGGFSPVDGPTGKGGENSGVIIKMSSADISTSGGRNLMAIIIAHEVGHFLGLEHASDSANFMAASTGGSNTAITHGQYLNLADHGFVTRFVP